jgi:hypothetical protein
LVAITARYLAAALAASLSGPPAAVPALLGGRILGLGSSALPAGTSVLGASLLTAAAGHDEVRVGVRTVYHEPQKTVRKIIIDLPHKLALSKINILQPNHQQP